MKAWILLPCIALCAGALIPVQAAANARLSQSIGSVIYSALMLFIVGLIVITGYLVVSRAPLPNLTDFTSAPAFSYLGGVIVATYVLSITYLAPKMGVASAICFIVTGQIIVAVLIDHFGWFNSPLQRMDLTRTFGVLLMIIGLFLARKE